MPGVYVVALTGDADRRDATRPTAEVDDAKLQTLLGRRPELRLDSRRPSPEQLRQRLGAFWLPDEPVVYIGMTDATVRKRVTAYYRTSLGARSPHAGGWFIQTLRNMDMLWVHFGSAAEPLLAEERMLAAFSGEVDHEARASLHDPQHAYPFANLKGPRGLKLHGITGAKEPRAARKGGVATHGAGGVPPSTQHTAALEVRMSTKPEANTPALRGLPSATLYSQPITAKDLAGGRVRITSRSGGKKLLPAEKTRITVQLRGRTIPNVRWDPKMGPERERSGVLGIGKACLNELVEEGEKLVLGKLAVDQFSLD